jgi:hypothetical protein
MLLNAWGIALSLLSITVAVFIIISCRTAWRVICHWNPASDSNRQISLENEIWLSSTLIEYILVIQAVSLILFILASDAFCKVIIGAMCATGTLLANPYGLPALFTKLTGVFVYGIWIIIHKLDISVESYPLVRLKYYYFLSIVPLLFLDIFLQTLFLTNLTPDIITSCCGVVFEVNNGSDSNLLGSIQNESFFLTFYTLTAFIFLTGILTLKKKSSFFGLAYSLSWLLFLPLSLLGITSVFSSYIYAMPYHHCPFCILKPDYNYIGFLLYGTLIPGALLALSVSVINLFRHTVELKKNIRHFQNIFVKISIFLLLLFIFSSSYHFLLYRFWGGEV